MKTRVRLQVEGFNEQGKISGHLELPPASHRKVTDPRSAAHSCRVSLWHFQGILWELEDGQQRAESCRVRSRREVGGRLVQDVRDRG